MCSSPVLEQRVYRNVLFCLLIRPFTTVFATQGCSRITEPFVQLSAERTSDKDHPCEESVIGRPPYLHGQSEPPKTAEEGREGSKDDPGRSESASVSEYSSFSWERFIVSEHQITAWFVLREKQPKERRAKKKTQVKQNPLDRERKRPRRMKKRTKKKSQSWFPWQRQAKSLNCRSALLSWPWFPFSCIYSNLWQKPHCDEIQTLPSLSLTCRIPRRRRSRWRKCGKLLEQDQENTPTQTDREGQDKQTPKEREKRPKWNDSHRSTWTLHTNLWIRMCLFCLFIPN